LELELELELELLLSHPLLQPEVTALVWTTEVTTTVLFAGVGAAGSRDGGAGWLNMAPTEPASLVLLTVRSCKRTTMLSDMQAPPTVVVSSPVPLLLAPMARGRSRLLADGGCCMYNGTGRKGESIPESITAMESFSILL
jgi:hypothetical protein